MYISPLLGRAIQSPSRTLYTAAERVPPVDILPVEAAVPHVTGGEPRKVVRLHRPEHDFLRHVAAHIGGRSCGCFDECPRWPLGEIKVPVVFLVVALARTRRISEAWCTHQAVVSARHMCGYVRRQQRSLAKRSRVKLLWGIGSVDLPLERIRVRIFGRRGERDLPCVRLPIMCEMIVRVKGSRMNLLHVQRDWTPVPRQLRPPTCPRYPWRRSSRVP